MAISATVSMANSTVQYNSQAVALVTIANSGSSDVTLSTLLPMIGSGVDVNTGVQLSRSGPTINPTTIPANGSIVLPFQLVPVAPQTTPSSLIQTTYSVGCQLTTSDGSVTLATPASLTVTPLAITP